MSEKDIIFLIGAVMGVLGGFSLGHLRGQCVGIAWAEKNGPWALAGYREGWKDAMSATDTFSPQDRRTEAE